LLSETVLSLDILSEHQIRGRIIHTGKRSKGGEMKDLDGKNVVVTGGSYGIGKEVARAFLREGANVFTIARNQEKLEASVEELSRDAKEGRRVRGYPCDVADREGISRVIDTIASEEGGLDVLVSNAGIVIPGYFEKLEVDDFEAVLNTNYLGAIYVIKAALPHLLSRGKSALAITSSPAGYKGVFGYSAYSPTKFALIGLAEVLRTELKSKGVQVTVLCPPETDTPGFAEEKRVRPQETNAVAGSSKLMLPADVAACFLRGFKKGKFMVICDFMSKLLYRVNGISPRFTDFILDIMAAQGRR
jgi:3-dehydrosphinganine reductase